MDAAVVALAVVQGPSAPQKPVVATPIPPGSVAIHGSRMFTLDGVLGVDSSAENQYDAAARAQVAGALAAGAGWTCVSYGPCGGGAERAVFGALDGGAGAGLAERAVRQVFQAAAGGGGAEWAVSLSALYLHQEQISDLLNPQKRNLQAVLARIGGPYVKDLSDVFVGNVEDGIDLLHAAASAQLALQSDGYGHTLVTLTVRQTRPDGTSRASKLTFAQLGGSDMARDGKSEVLHRINKGLSTLHSIVDELETGMTPEPSAYLRSSLTFVLRDALAGSSKATVIVNVGTDGGDACSSPEEAAQQCAAALQFGERMRLVQNSPVSDEQKDVGELEAQIRAVSDELSSHRKYIYTLETQLKEAGGMAPSMPSGRNFGPCSPDLDITATVDGLVDPAVLAVWSAGRMSSLSPDLMVLLAAQIQVLQQEVDAANKRVALARQRLAMEQEVTEERSTQLQALDATQQAEALLLQWGKSELERLSTVHDVQSAAATGTFDLLAGGGAFDLLGGGAMPVAASPAASEGAHGEGMTVHKDELEVQMEATVADLERENAELEAELAECEARQTQMRARLLLRAERWNDVEIEEEEEEETAATGGAGGSTAPPPVGGGGLGTGGSMSPPVGGGEDAQVDMLGFASVLTGYDSTMFSGLEMMSPAGGAAPSGDLLGGASPTVDLLGGDDLLQMQADVERDTQARIDAELANVAVRAEQDREDARKAEQQGKIKAEADARRARIEAKRQHREASMTTVAPPAIDLLSGAPVAAPVVEQSPPVAAAPFDLLSGGGAGGGGGMMMQQQPAASAPVAVGATGGGAFDLLGNMPVAASPWPQQEPAAAVPDVAPQHAAAAEQQRQALLEQQRQQAAAEAEARKQRLAAKREATAAASAPAPAPTPQTHEQMRQFQHMQQQAQSAPVAFGGSVPAPAPAPDVFGGFGAMAPLAPQPALQDLMGGFNMLQAPAPAPAPVGFGGVAPARSSASQLLGMSSIPPPAQQPFAAASADPFAMFAGGAPAAVAPAGGNVMAGFGSMGVPAPGLAPGDQCGIGGFGMMQAPSQSMMQAPALAPQVAQQPPWDLGAMTAAAPAPAMMAPPVVSAGRGRGRGRGAGQQQQQQQQQPMIAMQPMQPTPQPSTQQRHYACEITRGPAGFGINIEEDAMGNAIVGAVTGHSALQAGVKQGSIFVVVGGSAVQGQGRAGVVQALQQPHVAALYAVDFIFDAPAPNAAINW